MPEISKITTIHSSSNLTEEESERIIKLIKGKVAQAQILIRAFDARLRRLQLMTHILLLTGTNLEAEAKTFAGVFL